MEGFEGRVGKCTLEPEELRAAKATYTGELFVALQKVNHIRLVKKDGTSRPLSADERALIMEMLHSKKEVTYKAIRKKLNIDETYKFNMLTYSEKKGF